MTCLMFETDINISVYWLDHSCCIFTFHLALVSSCILHLEVTDPEQCHVLAHLHPPARQSSPHTVLSCVRDVGQRIMTHLSKRRKCALVLFYLFYRCVCCVVIDDRKTLSALMRIFAMWQIIVLFNILSQMVLIVISHNFFPTVKLKKGFEISQINIVVVSVYYISICLFHLFIKYVCIVA